MEARRFYAPRGEGAEGPVRERLERWAALREAKRSASARPGEGRDPQAASE